MQSVIRLLSFAVSNFGPLISFYGLNHFYGLRVAIIGSILFSVLEIVYKLVKKAPFTGFFRFSVFITVVFGIADLCIQTPMFIRFEAVITNLITAGYFGMTLWASKSFIQEWIEKKEGVPLTDQVRIIRCRAMTLIWTIYFVLKAGFYAYVSSHYAIEEAMIIRTTVGTASFYALLGFSIFCARPVFNFFKIGNPSTNLVQKTPVSS